MPGLLLLVTIILGKALGGCSTENLAEPYTPLSREDEARKALDQGDYERAVPLYEELLAAHTEDHRYHPLLASALAGRAGFNLLDLIKAQTRPDNGGKDPIELLGDLLPSRPTQGQLADFEAAVATLLAIPVSERDGMGEGKPYSAAAGFLLTIFQSAYSLMYMNQFVLKNEDGTLDRTRLEELTVEDVDKILSNLESVRANAPQTAEGQAVAQAIGKVLDNIEGQEGDQRERLIKYIEGSRGGESQS